MARKSRELAALEKRLKKLPRAAFEALAQAMVDSADEVHARSRDLAPQLTGDMILHSGVDVEQNHAAGKLSVSIHYDERYALYQHEGYYNPGPVTRQKLGSQFAIGRKFLSRAMDERREATVQRASRTLARTLRLSLR